MENKTTRIILMRHGESKNNAKGVFQGQKYDDGLSMLGHKQARAAAKLLKDFEIAKIFTSVYPRAIQTAEHIKKFHQQTPYFELPKLNERFIGDAEGMHKNDFPQRYAHILADWHKEIDTRPEGGESFEDVHNRVVPLIKEHINQNIGKTLLYVIHGNVIRVVLGYALSIPFGKQSRIKQDNCALNSFVFDHDSGRWEVEYINRSVL